jgi:hypothetical protein
MAGPSTLAKLIVELGGSMTIERLRWIELGRPKLHHQGNDPKPFETKRNRESVQELRDLDWLEGETEDEDRDQERECHRLAVGHPAGQSRDGTSAIQGLNHP